MSNHDLSTYATSLIRELYCISFSLRDVHVRKLVLQQTDQLVQALIMHERDALLRLTILEELLPLIIHLGSLSAVTHLTLRRNILGLKSMLVFDIPVVDAPPKQATLPPQSGLTDAQTKIMALLVNSGSKSTTTLCHELGDISPKTLRRQIEPLIHKNMVSKNVLGKEVQYQALKR